MLVTLGSKYTKHIVLCVTKARHIPVLFTCNSTVLWEAQHFVWSFYIIQFDRVILSLWKNLTPFLALSVVLHVLQENALSHCSAWICNPALESPSPRKHKVLWTILVLRSIYGLFRNANICGSLSLSGTQSHHPGKFNKLAQAVSLLFLFKIVANLLTAWLAVVSSVDLPAATERCLVGRGFVGTMGGDEPSKPVKSGGGDMASGALLGCLSDLCRG